MKMKPRLVGFCFVGLMLFMAFSLTGCSTVVVGTAKLAWEDRSTDDQFTDTKIGASILSSLADKDKNLLFDVNADVWETRLMLTGTVSDAKIRQSLIQMARTDTRIKKIYDEIQVVSLPGQTRRRDAAKSRDDPKKDAGNRVINDFWIETKISAQLVSAREVTSVNYRWRSVRNIIYLIGRAQSKGELKSVLEIIRATEGVQQVKSFVEIKPMVKS
jgi:hyperosmotically inducible protein